MLDEIQIGGLRLDALIGVYPHEREAVQPLLLDVALGRDQRQAASSDDVADTIDYAEVVKQIREFVAAREDQLLERLVDALADFLMDRHPARYLRLRVEKPLAAAALGCATVAVCVQRQR